MSKPSYYYGRPPRRDARCVDVIDAFAARESLKSARTSSLPLVQFWNDDEKLPNRVTSISEDCNNLEILSEDSTLCFEYAVPVGGGRGKASMTDLMIITRDHAIAIEAKFTECKKNYETIDDWLKKGNKSNKMKVLQGWLDYILAHDKTLQIKEAEGLIGKGIPYQMLHRIASACKVATDSKDLFNKEFSPVVIYQLFYENETPITGRKARFVAESDVKKFADILERAKEKLGLHDVIQFHVVKTCTHCDIPKGFSRDCLNALFDEIKNGKKIYSFERD